MGLSWQTVLDVVATKPGKLTKPEVVSFLKMAKQAKQAPDAQVMKDQFVALLQEADEGQLSRGIEFAGAPDEPQAPRNGE